MDSSKIHAAIGVLAEARDYAQDVRGDAWDFSVEIETLLSTGATPNDLRWLVAKQYVEAACEEGTECGGPRRLKKCRNCFFTKRTCDKRACFVLTDAGLDFARTLQCNTQPPPPHFSAPLPNPATSETLAPFLEEKPTPHWDAELRELRVDGSLVKRFRTRAPNQEAILSAFQEEGWPPHIYDPLTATPSQEQPPQRRLNDTVRGLNRYQRERLVRFSTDGTGEGVRWEWG